MNVAVKVILDVEMAPPVTADTVQAVMEADLPDLSAAVLSAVTSVDVQATLEVKLQVYSAVVTDAVRSTTNRVQIYPRVALEVQETDRAGLAACLVSARDAIASHLTTLATAQGWTVVAMHTKDYA